jgi:hypothetical protein
MTSRPEVHLCLFGCGLVVNSAPTRQSPHTVKVHRQDDGTARWPSEVIHPALCRSQDMEHAVRGCTSSRLELTPKFSDHRGRAKES